MKRYLSFILIAVSLFAACHSVYAKGIDPKADAAAIRRMRARMDEIRLHRPTVALVLSGGGAKGAAHVGVIEHIESLGIPVDMVLGTSMGGLIGGLYALGYSTEQMDSLVRNMDWN
jgi:NTE family protein